MKEYGEYIFHAYNKLLSARSIQEYLQSNGERIKLSGFCAYHQNGVMKRVIVTITGGQE